MAITLQESRPARFGTLCSLYFSQGVPWAFIAVAFVAYLVGHDTYDISDDEVAKLTLMGTLPWMFGKLILGPMIDRYQSSTMGRRRPWILLSQFGMIVTMAAFLFIDNPETDFAAIGMFFLIHNIFAALQDVSSDALAVDVLKEEEVALANGLMFVSKGFGFMFAALILGSVLLDSGFQAALTVQIPLLFVLMFIPFFIREREGDSLFLGGTREDSQEDASMNFRELKDALSGVLKESSTRWALLLAAIVWIGGGMGGGMGIIDMQFPFVFIDDLGWSEESYLALKGFTIFMMTMAGFLVGGFLGKKFGSHKVMMYAVGIGTIMTVAWSGLRGNWSDDSFMQMSWMIWTFVWGIVGANLIALLMILTTSELGGTQFSLYMTAINIGAITGTMISPKLLELLNDNFPNLFIVGALFQALVFLVLMKMGPSLESTQSPTASVIIESE
jgi:PAT family beta-lactamase induction signal transducer AmpG|tara:strand:+ start:800 stop:2134 length:1335 start_codon:yes stop_codon:yes gene_type:complete